MFMLRKNIMLKLLLLIFMAINVLANEKCAFKDNCEECLAENYLCSWCTDKNFNGTSRCMTKSDLLRENCFVTNIIENHEEFQITEDIPTQDYVMIDLENEKKRNARAVQVRPQKLKLKLVKGKSQQFKMTYRLARNYPLDLYFLMDSTWSMKDDKETLIKLGSELAETLTSLTKNYRLGFGSFADKPGMPINPSEKFKTNPCSYEGATCGPTYDFKHDLALTTDIESFINSVKDSKITGNLENMEGQLDALMQVIVCTESIGWSNDARKIVILATDGYMHFAGDGILLGVTQRNDKKCHLNKDGLYTGDLTYDYPSIEEIYRELLRRKVNVIFAVEKAVSSHYMSMGKLMHDISAVEILSSNSSNILELVRNAYQTLINKVQFEDTSPDIISVKYFTDCGGKNHSLQEQNYCNNIKLGDEIDFLINITLDEYPKDNNWNYLIKIGDSGLSEDIEIQVEVQKPCPCEEQPIKDDSGRLPCNNHGHLKCGMCICDENWLGTYCSCDSENYTTNQALENLCRYKYPSGELGSICSNHGECDCGKCQCSFFYEGKYCECLKCPNCNDEIEECQCGECVCKYGWMNGRCCVKAKNGCINPVDRSTCSNNGECDTCTDKCSCKDNYLGKYCEYNVNGSAKEGFCEKYEPCAKILIYDNQGIEHVDDKDSICRDEKGPYTYKIETESIDANVKCLLRLNYEDGEYQCDHYFEYKIDENEISHLKIEQNDCTPINYAILGIITLIITLIVGILSLLMYKLCLVLQDRKECDKFNKEALEMQEKIKEGKMEETNPLYKNPVTHYSIPKLDEN
ncbi:integrin beta-nu [Condylostylus longicornis]|uniref:integrin beta-nu n=1 Tax=Condylostylus longicornis TaxID=2530218 RepID=UPI00244E134E|nr:integrin beta-nu [Condylostylus longicornis]